MLCVPATATTTHSHVFRSREFYANQFPLLSCQLLFQASICLHGINTIIVQHRPHDIKPVILVILHVYHHLISYLCIYNQSKQIKNTLIGYANWISVGFFPNRSKLAPIELIVLHMFYQITDSLKFVEIFHFFLVRTHFDPSLMSLICLVWWMIKWMPT